MLWTVIVREEGKTVTRFYITINSVPFFRQKILITIFRNLNMLYIQHVIIKGQIKIKFSFFNRQIQSPKRKFEE